MGTTSFWLILLASSARQMGMTSVILHQVACLTDIGISEVVAATTLGLTVAMSIPGRLAFGWLGDRFDKRYVTIVTYVLQAIGIMFLANVKAIEQVYIFLVLFGLGYGGSIPLYSAIIGEYFGRKAFATIRGFMQMFQLIPTVIGPIFAGYIYDVTGSYQNAFMTFALLYIIGAGVFPFIKRPTVKKKQL